MGQDFFKMSNNISYNPRLVACRQVGSLFQHTVPIILCALWRPVAAALAPTYGALELFLALARPDFIWHLAAETLA